MLICMASSTLVTITHQPQAAATSLLWEGLRNSVFMFIWKKVPLKPNQCRVACFSTLAPSLHCPLSLLSSPTPTIHLGTAGMNYLEPLGMFS